MSLKRYVSSLLSLDLSSIQREFQTIQAMANKPEPYILLQVLHAEPTKLLPGMRVYADGVDWNPGSGEGEYRRDKTNTSWLFLG